MRVLVSPKNKLMVFWSPKAGCSTVANIFLSHEGFSVLPDEWIHKARSRYEAEVHPNRIPDDVSGYRKIQFVRSPRERSVSSFFLNLEHHFGGSHNLAQAKESFLRFLDEVARDQVTCPRCRFHSRPQFMTEELDMVVKIERLEEGINEANERFGLKLDSSLVFHPHSYRASIRKNGQNPEGIYEQLLEQEEVPTLLMGAYGKDMEFFDYF